MNYSHSKAFKIGCTLLVVLAITGLLEERAYTYIRHISEQNLGFLGVMTELKLVLSGISDFVPFLKGNSGSFNDSLDKVENYLLITNGIALVELMIVGMSKSWLVKLLILLLLLVTILRRSANLSARLLILALTLNPGLQLFAVGMDYLSASVSIDYGDTYLTRIKASVEEVKKEKAQISQQHAKHLQEINNGKKGLVFFKKLKEDISYDVKKTTTSIKGDYMHLRMLIHDGGKELVKKISIFCSMVLFSLVLMPIGYALIVYTVYKTVLAQSVASETGHVKQEELKWFKPVKHWISAIRGNAKEVKTEVSELEKEVEEIPKPKEPQLTTQNQREKPGEVENQPKEEPKPKPPPISI